MISTMFYYLICVALGILGACGTKLDSFLSARYTPYIATVWIGISGVLVLGFILLVTKQKPHLSKTIPPYTYTAGLCGFLATLLSYYSLKYLSITAALTIHYLGENLLSLIVDTFGLFGIKKRKVSIREILGLAIMFVGIWFILK